MASICGSPVCAGGKPQLKFTYTGDYVVRKDGVVELLTSGTIVFLEPKVIDVFMVGGGGSGWTQIASDFNGYGGGGGGYTRTVKRLNVQANAQIPVTIGAGGIYSTASGSGKGSDGGYSGFNTLTVSGGEHGNGYIGGAGGSGGGAGVASNSDFGAGGSDGSNGEAGDTSTKRGGTGQDFTTREFGEATGKLYAGGGGGGQGIYGSYGTAGAGGEGGGANGNSTTDATANTGGGGGGGKGFAGGGGTGGQGTAGGSGIVCIRLHQDDPTENVLSGTWKFNDTLTMPSTLFTENFDYDGTFAYAGSNFYTVMGARAFSGTTDLCFGHNSGDLSTNYVLVYDFTHNMWRQATAKTIKFWNRYQVVSPEFYAWFTANATKISD